ncbi:recombinase family protein [Thermobrachium celere]|uniref:Site-specific recombinase n=1 Tax=Thermobrachium celere DSM 8682 TaxID=941824 RepID=R7RSL2_9CLOT|nr:recombinase family protein [Thermobrachium celere]CDF58283.1 hypothetical protein TCEL_00329 [Thermobrachium celere DSM 8682]
MEVVAIYVRLSDEDRDKANKMDESESIQNQKDMLIRYANERGWKIYKIYSDEDYSGLDKDRPEFNQMIRDAEQGKFNIILCKHQSRFSRDMELVEKYLHNKFIEWNIRFVSVVDGVDTKDKHNKKSRQVNALINEWYCEDISESIKAVFRVKQKSGKFIGSFPCFGYKKDEKDKNRLVIDEEAAKIVRDIFNWYLDGYGTQKIADMLNEKNIPNPSKYKLLKGMNVNNSFVSKSRGYWNKTTVKRILKNRMYVGDMVQHVYEKLNYKSKKTVKLKESDWIIVENTHEPIIDRETFNKVQKRLKSKVRSLGTGKSHIFAGKVKCLDCKSTMQKTTNNAKRSYLRCKLYCISKGKLCTKHTIRLDRLENIVADKIKEHFRILNENEIVEGLNDMTFDLEIKNLEKELSRINNDIKTRDTALKNIYLDKTKGMITEEQFLEFNKVFLDEKNTLLARKQYIESQIENLRLAEEKKSKIVEKVRSFLNFDRLTYDMVNELIDYIEIGEKDKRTNEQEIIIHWLF